jgi:hypothetical protein
MPSDFDFTTLESLHEINEDGQIWEVYGNLNPSPLISSGRGKNNPLLPQVDFPKLAHYITLLHERKMRFNYTLNPSCIENYELTNEGRKKLLEFIQRLCEIKVDSVSVALPALIQLIKANFPQMDICGSTIIGVDSVNKAKFYESLGCGRIVLKEDKNRDFKVMESIVRSINIPVEVIVNTKCQFECGLRPFHYNSISHDPNVNYYERYYTDICQNIHLNEFLKTRWIRPEDIFVYENIGIRYFKIIGRLQVGQSDLPGTAKKYINRNYDGNLIELIYNFPKDVKTRLTIPNKRLDGFLKYFIDMVPDCSNVCGTKCNYCYDVFNKIAGTDSCVDVNPKKQTYYFFKHGILELLKADEISRVGYEVKI